MPLLVVVDDEEFVLKAVARQLADWADQQSLEIATFTSPLAALARVEQDPDSIQLLLSDARMAELPGVELLSRVKKTHPRIVTFLFTGYADLNEVVSGVKAGIFGVVLKPWTEEYLIGELEKGLALVRLEREHRENVRRMEADLKLAGQVQASLLEFTLPPDHRLQLSMVSRPSDPFGCMGDYTDAFDLGNGTYALLVGDVAGHGVSAALITGVLKAIIYSEYIRHHRGGLIPSRFLAWLNGRLSSVLGKTGLIVTFSCLVFDMNLGTVTIALAGHPSPLVVRSGRVGHFQQSGSALGFVTGVVFPEKSLKLTTGDTLWVYTDGLIEVGGRSSHEGISALSDQAAGLEPDSTPEELVSRVLQGSGAEHFDDDVTLVKCRVL